MALRDYVEIGLASQQSPRSGRYKYRALAQSWQPIRTRARDVQEDTAGSIDVVEAYQSVRRWQMVVRVSPGEADSEFGTLQTLFDLFDSDEEIFMLLPDEVTDITVCFEGELSPANLTPVLTGSYSHYLVPLALVELT